MKYKIERSEIISTFQNSCILIDAEDVSVLDLTKCAKNVVQKLLKQKAVHIFQLILIFMKFQNTELIHNWRLPR